MGELRRILWPPDSPTWFGFKLTDIRSGAVFACGICLAAGIDDSSSKGSHHMLTYVLWYGVALACLLVVIVSTAVIRKSSTVPPSSGGKGGGATVLSWTDDQGSFHVLYAPGGQGGHGGVNMARPPVDPVPPGHYVFAPGAALPPELRGLHRA